MPQLRGKLTERLIAQGLLTPNMLQELRREWDNSQSSNPSNRYSSDDDDDDDPSPFKKYPRRFKRSKK